jgi:hypothetical protein
MSYNLTPAAMSTLRALVNGSVPTNMSISAELIRAGLAYEANHGRRRC